MTIESIYHSDIGKALDSRVAQARWICHVMNSLDQLDPIDTIVKFGSGFTNEELTLGDKPDVPVLRLMYSGLHKDAESAIADLAAIMIATKCFFGDLIPTYLYDVRALPENHGYGGVYEGDGRFGDVEVLVRLTVPWMPLHCKVREDKSPQLPAAPSWTVVCPKEGDDTNDE